MPLKPPRTTETEGGMDETQGRVQPIRPVWQGALIWLVGLFVFLAVVAFAVRAFLIPALSGTSSPSAAEAHLGQLQTEEALTSVPTAQPALAPTAVPTVVAAVAPTVVPTAAPATSTPVSAPAVAAATVVPTAAPTVSPELAAEVSQAYLRFFQVRADALYSNDESQLDQIAAGDALAGLRTAIEQNREAGRAIRIDVAHNYKVVAATDESADVADDYRDSSVYIDPDTKQLLPGEVVPASAADAPEVKVVYHLQQMAGVWKVVSGERFQ